MINETWLMCRSLYFCAAMNKMDMSLDEAKSEVDKQRVSSELEQAAE